MEISSTAPCSGCPKRRNTKTETRRPKEVPKPEIQRKPNRKRICAVRAAAHSGFGLRASDLLRPSGFGFEAGLTNLRLPLARYNPVPSQAADSSTPPPPPGALARSFAI